jgi:hypothetical protein
MADFKLDKTAFRMMSFKEADDANIFDQSVPYEERLRQAYYLISQVYGFDLASPLRLDKTCYSEKKFG